MSARDTILSSAMQLAAERGWSGISLGDIAAAAGVPLADLYGEFRSKRSILSAVVRKADEAMLATAAAQPGGSYSDDEPVRDRLFDVLMARFDALQPYRDGLAAAARDTLKDPCAMATAGLCHGNRLIRSMGWALEAAGVKASGPRGMVRTRGLAAVYASVLPVWLRDESGDLSATMAGLDKRLTRAEKLAGMMQGRGRTRGMDEDGDMDTPAPPPPRSTPKKAAPKKAAPKKATAKKSASKKPATKKAPRKKAGKKKS